VEVYEILTMMIGVSVLYYALVFYCSLVKNTIGGAIRLAERLRPARRL